MGEIADSIINGDIDEQTGEWLGGGKGSPRTLEPGNYNTIKKQVIPDWNKDNYLKGTKAIRKELAILIKEMKKESPNENENIIVNRARQQINLKYGKGWREQF